MIERLVILAAVVAVGLLVVRISERTRPRGRSLPPGTTVVTGPDCRLCEPLVERLDAAGVSYRRVPVTEVPGDVPVRALPTVLVADPTGRIVLRRSGRSAVDDVEVIAAVAASGGAVSEVG